MYEPSPKADAVDEMINAVLGRDRRATIMQGLCMTCERGLICHDCNLPRTQHEVTPSGHVCKDGSIPHWFRDSLSNREYTISGMCQRCQDAVFGISEDGFLDEGDQPYEEGLSNG